MTQQDPKPGSAEEAGKTALAAYLPEFFAAVGEFPDLKAEPGLSDEDIAALEQRLDFRLSEGLKRLVRQCAAISMNGLSVRAAHFGPIVMPSSEALIIGELYLHNDGDRLLMLPNDETVYYLEQRNGAITKLADSLENFFNQTLPRHLYG
ncbi:MAG: SMI1/KNR4 family protein [Desulfovibrio sp.]|uniref:SMI1/KNR4 family protein n=1 Tax=Desulfovibrio sp. TaxID=885 RepID=UPI001A7C5F04|nr:SMI1/KNR4 family protein [Desulfovibrio sp.]MBD5417259.1 SMI1/KNR4 family protein [Desulfovibrio sp.]